MSGPLRALEFMRSLWALDHALHRTSKGMARRLGVTGPQRLVLRLVGQHPSITAGELARVMHTHPSTLTGILSRLQQAGLILRRIDSDDRRQARLVLSRAGRRIDRRTAGTIEAVIARALARMAPADVAAAARVLAALTASLREKPRKPVARRRPADRQ